MTDKRQSTDRRRYRKIFTRLWRHPKFRGLSDGEKVMTLYILSGPQTNRIGLFLFSIGEAHEDLDVPVLAIKRRLAAVCKAFEWLYDSESRVIWIPSWWTFNDPKDNLKAFQGALTDLNDVPPTPLMQRFCRNLVGIPEALRGLMAPLTEGIPDPIPDHIPVPIPDGIHDGIPDRIGVRSQEQEQEQETKQEQEQETPARALLELWNDCSNELPKAQTFSPDRLKHAQARLREQPDLAWWGDVFRRMNASDFLTGRTPSKDHPNWRADVDFALKPGVAGKVLEGKYDNRPLSAMKVIKPWTCPHETPCSNPGMCANATTLGRPRKTAVAS